ncbi:MAG: hypothetical protein M3Q49_15835 [Actinomycetota bacterium]|nr:hypothetical protein [Actinomycetota bacterium]
MTFYEDEIREFWEAYQRYLVERQRLVFTPDGQQRYAGAPGHVREEARQRLKSVMDEYDNTLERLTRTAMRDATRLNEEYEADPSREDAWVRSRAALEFLNILNGTRGRFREQNNV